MSTPAFLQSFLAQERGLFRKVVEAVPESGLDHRPDPKARTTRDLIEHLIGHNLDLVELLEEGEIHHRNQVPFDSLEDAVQRLDASFAEVIEKLGSVDDEQWSRPGGFWVGENKLMEAPCQQLAWLMFMDAVHHRGQLTTYLRPMGGKVPAIYGPSADDPGQTP